MGMNDFTSGGHWLRWRNERLPEKVQWLKTARVRRAILLRGYKRNKRWDCSTRLGNAVRRKAVSVDDERRAVIVLFALTTTRPLRLDDNLVLQQLHPAMSSSVSPPAEIETAPVRQTYLS